MLKEYIEYFNDNPKGLWFKRKLYGYGWTPVRWEGWLSIAVYLVAVLYLFIKADNTSHSNSDTLISFALPFIVATSLLILLCYKKGEKPKWQWGPEKKG